MKFINRLGYYLSGFSIGLIILIFILNQKNASCSYGPNARTVKNISSKPLVYSNKTQLYLNKSPLDSVTIVNLIKYGDVDFSRSNIKHTDSCKIYVIENSYKNIMYELNIVNCDSVAIIENIQLKN